MIWGDLIVILDSSKLSAEKFKGIAHQPGHEH